MITILYIYVNNIYTFTTCIKSFPMQWSHINRNYGGRNTFFILKRFQQTFSKLLFFFCTFNAQTFYIDITRNAKNKSEDFYWINFLICKMKNTKLKQQRVSSLKSRKRSRQQWHRVIEIQRCNDGGGWYRERRLDYRDVIFRHPLTSQ